MVDSSWLIVHGLAIINQQWLTGETPVPQSTIINQQSSINNHQSSIINALVE